MPKNKYYYYDHEACTFVEVQPERHKVFLHSALVLALAFVLAGAGMWVVYETSSTPKELALQQENQALQQQLVANGARFEELSARLDHLADTDRDLYRTIFQADPISDDVRRVGVGGAATTEFDGFSAATSTLLRENSATLDKLERQLALQRSSYDELFRLARERAEAIPQMPAILPVSGALTSGFGMRLHPIHRVHKMHAGVDFSVPTGTPVYATGDGFVAEAGPRGGYGNMVEIQHPNGYTTRYAHLSSVAARRGGMVRQGDLVGFVGATGLATGPHLHYEVRHNGAAVDPVIFLRAGRVIRDLL